MQDAFILFHVRCADGCTGHEQHSSIREQVRRERLRRALLVGFHVALEYVEARTEQSLERLALQERHAHAATREALGAVAVVAATALLLLLLLPAPPFLWFLLLLVLLLRLFMLLLLLQLMTLLLLLLMFLLSLLLRPLLLLLLLLFVDGVDAGRADAVLEQRHLAEVVSGGELRHFRLASVLGDGDARRASLDEVHPVGDRVALRHDPVAVRERDGAQRVGKRGALIVVERAEHRDAAQQPVVHLPLAERALQHETAERVPTHRPQPALGHGNDSGGSRLVVHEGELAETAAAVELQHAGRCFDHLAALAVVLVAAVSTTTPACPCTPSSSWLAPVLRRVVMMTS